MSLFKKIGLSSIAFALAIQSSVASTNVKKVDIDVRKLPSTVLTTIADVKADQDGAVVYANNDIRVLRISSDSKKMIDEAILAKKNGWEVKLVLKTTDDKGQFEITSLQIKSRKNVLTTGFNMPDRNFSPIIARSGNEAQALFNSVYPYEADNYDVDDNCFNRAQYWSRMHQVSQKLQGSHKGTDKVFIFFTEEYRRKYNHKWWYHVAPMIYVGDKSNPVVLDPTFMNSAVTLKDWLSAFDHHTHGNCVKGETLQDYYRYGNEPVCLYITASMFNYNPTDLNAQKLTNWRCSDFNRVVTAIPAPGARSTNFSATWSDSQNRYLIPEMCGGPSIPVAAVEPVPTPVAPPAPTPTPAPVEENKPAEFKWTGRIKGESSTANIYAGPGSSHRVLGSLAIGTLVDLKLSGNEWLEITVPAGILGAEAVRGFVPKANIELVR